MALVSHSSLAQGSEVIIPSLIMLIQFFKMLCVSSTCIMNCKNMFKEPICLSFEQVFATVNPINEVAFKTKKTMQNERTRKVVTLYLKKYQ